MTSDIVIYIATGLPIGALAIALWTHPDNSAELRECGLPMAIIGLVLAAFWPITVCGLILMGLVVIMRRYIRKIKEGGK